MYILYSFINSSVDGHWGCFYFWLVWITLLWIFTLKFLCEYMFSSFLLGIYQGLELLNHMLSNFFSELHNCFSKVTSFYIPPTRWGSKFLIFVNTCYWLSYFEHLIGCEMVSICISLMFNIFSCVYWPSVYHLGRYISSNHLPT